MECMADLDYITLLQVYKPLEVPACHSRPGTAWWKRCYPSPTEPGWQIFSSSSPGTHISLVALLWLWGAWLSPVLSSCTTGRPAECKAALSAPGTNLAGEGFDVVTMERKQAYVIDVDTWRKTANGTCTLCVNPFMEGKTQRLPAAVVDWRPSQKCNMRLASMVYDSSEAFVSSSQTEVDVSWKIGLDVMTPQAKGLVMVGGTHSTAAKTVMSQSKKDKYSFIKQDIHCSYYSYCLLDNPPLHPEFSRSLGLLPPPSTLIRPRLTTDIFLPTLAPTSSRRFTWGGW